MRDLREDDVPMPINVWPPGLFGRKCIVTRGRKIIAALPIVILLFSTAAVADEIKVLCPPPLRATLAELTPLFERESRHRLLVSYEPSKAIIEHVKSGEVPDIVLLTVPNVDELRALGLVEDRVDLRDIDALVEEVDGKDRLDESAPKLGDGCRPLV